MGASQNTSTVYKFDKVIPVSYGQLSPVMLRSTSTQSPLQPLQSFGPVSLGADESVGSIDGAFEMVGESFMVGAVVVPTCTKVIVVLLHWHCHPIQGGVTMAIWMTLPGRMVSRISSATLSPRRNHEPGC